MTSFSALVEDAFTSAEKRARDIGTFLAEATQSVTSAITQQFDDVRSTTGKERERTAAALRSAYEQANSQMKEVFQSSLDGFRSSAEEMLGLSAKIQQELENTREELKRGALELPQETAAQTNAMRKVVDDQIRALNELTEIVTKSGRAFDVSEPKPVVTQPVSQVIERARPVEAPAPRAEVAPAPRPSAPKAEAPKTEAPIAEAPKAAKAPEPAPARTEQSRQAEPVAAPGQPSRNSGGWLSDLLAGHRKTNRKPRFPQSRRNRLCLPHCLRFARQSPGLQQSRQRKHWIPYPVISRE